MTEAGVKRYREGEAKLQELSDLHAKIIRKSYGYDENGNRVKNSLTKTDAKELKALGKEFAKKSKLLSKEYHSTITSIPFTTESGKSYVQTKLIDKKLNAMIMANTEVKGMAFEYSDNKNNKNNNGVPKNKSKEDKATEDIVNDEEFMSKYLEREINGASDAELQKMFQQELDKRLNK